MASDQIVSADMQIGSSRTTLSVLRYWGPVGLYAGIIFWGSSISNPPEAISSILKEVSDKILHMCEYSILGALSYRACRHGASGLVSRHAVLAAVIGSALYGVSDETHQLFVPFREADVLDLVADAFGSTLGAWGWRLMERHKGAPFLSQSGT